MADIKVGQELWWVPAFRHSTPQNITVVSVGRKWVNLSNNERFDINNPSMVADGRQYSSPGRCWLTRESWVGEQARQEAWRRIRDFCQRHVNAPDNLGSDKIAAAFKLIGGGE